MFWHAVDECEAFYSRPDQLKVVAFLISFEQLFEHISFLIISYQF